MDNSALFQLSEITIGDQDVRLADLISAAFNGCRICLSKDAAWLDKLRKGREVLEDSLSGHQKIYGVSTGVGYGSSETIRQDHIQSFAYQIIRQHGCGVGPFLSEQEGRAVVFARLVSLAKGYSAVRVELLQALADLLNCGVIPVIPSLGSVGASGDLTPLSYVASVLMGEREAYYQGEIIPAVDALEHAGLHPHYFAPKESLAIMNGTSVMTALGIITVYRLGNTFSMCEKATALAVEVLYGRSQAFHPLPHQLKKHPGQIVSAATIYKALSGSRLIDHPIDYQPVVQSDVQADVQVDVQADEGRAYFTIVACNCKD